MKKHSNRNDRFRRIQRGRRKSGAPASFDTKHRRPVIADRIVQYPLGELKPFPKNPIDEAGTILCGHARWNAAQNLNMTHVPTITVHGLGESQKKALVISDNRLPEQALWDNDLLRGHFENLVELDFDVELTGFSTGEVDLIIDGKSETTPSDPIDDLSGVLSDGPAVSRQGDLWNLGPHRLICDDALKTETYERLLIDETAQMVVTDPPFNVPIQGHVMGRGRIQHREFKMAGGEMSPAQFTAFLGKFIRHAIAASQNGSIHYIFMDWRHQYELLAAAHEHYAEQKALLVWNKTNAGQGSFYRSKHELILVSKMERRHTSTILGSGAKAGIGPTFLTIPASTPCIRLGEAS